MNTGADTYLTDNHTLVIGFLLEILKFGHFYTLKYESGIEF